MTKDSHILVVDDDERICNLLVMYLGKEGYKVNYVCSGEAMHNYLKTESPDLVILDLILPDADGLELARDMRQHPNTSVIMLTAKGDTVDKIVGLETGADDYIAKPFDNRELLARVRTVLRRTKSTEQALPQMSADNEHIAHFANWKFDLIGYELISPEGKNINLTSYEYKLLSAFVLSGNRVMKREHLINLIAEREWHPDDRSIDVLIGKLRKKIEPDPLNPTLIKTMRGTGYKFTAKVELSKK